MSDDTLHFLANHLESPDWARLGEHLPYEWVEQADLRKDEFLALLAHELRNPLAPISAAADLLRVGRADEARLRQISEIQSRSKSVVIGPEYSEILAVTKPEFSSTS